MDRPDEKKANAPDELTDREGDVLGLGGSSVPKSPGDPSVSNDPESIRKRRVRAQDDELDERQDRRDDDPFRQSKGATGIDMGVGGRGTDISGE